MERRRKWVVRAAQSLAILTGAWIIGWYLGGYKVAFAALALAILWALFGAFTT